MYQEKSIRWRLICLLTACLRTCEGHGTRGWQSAHEILPSRSLESEVLLERKTLLLVGASQHHYLTSRRSPDSARVPYSPQGEPKERSLREAPGSASVFSPDPSQGQKLCARLAEIEKVEKRSHLGVTFLPMYLLFSYFAQLLLDGCIELAIKSRHPL